MLDDALDILSKLCTLLECQEDLDMNEEEEEFLLKLSAALDCREGSWCTQERYLELQRLWRKYETCLASHTLPL